MKRAHLLSLGALAALALSVQGQPANAPAPPTVPKAAVDAVKGALPKGWSADAKGDTLIVRRAEEVSLYNPINIPPNAEPRSSRSSTGTRSHSSSARS
jgi:hypothetical protein